MVTQFLFGVGQRIRGFPISIWKQLFSAVYLETALTLSMKKMITNRLETLFPMFSTVLCHEVLKYFQDCYLKYN